MSGHSKWANIKNKKEKADNARGKIFTKIGREIAIAVKEGGSDPNNNSKLRDVIAKAKAANVPNDNITRSIKKAAGELGSINYEEITYEGYGPNGIAMIVDVVTDNRNRTAAEVRHLFDKSGGSMGASGCVAWMFDKRGVIVIERTSDIDEDEIMKLCDEMLIPSENKELMTIVPEEPVTVASKYVEQKLEVAVPMFNIGYKSEPVSNEDIVRCEVLSDMVLAMLADETSDFYKRLYDEGLINSTFSSETFSGDGFFVPIFGGESREPEKVAQLIAEEIERRKQVGFTKEEFETVRKAYYGSLIRNLGNPEAIASGLIKAGLRSTGNAFSTIETVASVTAEDAAEFLRQRFDPENCTLSVIRSEEQEGKA